MGNISKGLHVAGVIGKYDMTLVDFADRLAVERMHDDRELDQLLAQVELPGTLCQKHPELDMLTGIVRRLQEQGKQVDRAQILVAHQEHKLAQKNHRIAELEANAKAFRAKIRKLENAKDERSHNDQPERARTEEEQPQATGNSGLDAAAPC